MRLSRLLMLGLASAYPLYWTAQFLLFFVPETLLGFWLGRPLQVLAVSYVQATSIVPPHGIFPAHWEALVFAFFFSAVIVGLGADQFLTGSLAIVFLGQAALLPFLSLALTSSGESLSIICAGVLSLGLMILGLQRILRLTGGLKFLERLALLTLLALLPQATLWLACKFLYSFFDVRFLLLRIVPLYLAAIVAATISSRSQSVFRSVRWTEIAASSAAAGLLILAIGLSGRSASATNSASSSSRLSARNATKKPPSTPSSLVQPCGTCQWDVNVANS